MNGMTLSERVPLRTSTASKDPHGSSFLSVDSFRFWMVHCHTAPNRRTDLHQITIRHAKGKVC
jgi:hypothetical protein